MLKDLIQPWKLCWRNCVKINLRIGIDIDHLYYLHTERTLKFSPFELLYGRRIRDLFSILYYIWAKDEIDEELKSTYQYILALRSELQESTKLALADVAVNS